MRTRVAAPLPGVYQDFRAVSSDAAQATDAMIRDAVQAGAQILTLHNGNGPAFRDGLLILPDGPQAVPVDGPDPGGKIRRKRLLAAYKQFPDEVFAIAGGDDLPRREQEAFKKSSVHVLARELTAADVEAAIHAGRFYSAQDWLCDPAGFFFVAEGALGTYDIGDTVPMVEGLRLRVRTPVAAHIEIRDAGGAVVAETTGRELSAPVKQSGDYIAVARLNAAGVEMMWIDTQPVHIGGPAKMNLPSGGISDAVTVERGIAYVDDGIEKHKLDLFLPKGKTNFPVMVFLHGGSWREGDRSMYGLLGERFAKAGIGVAIPSYRLMPKDPYPAQVEDAAAAFVWVYRNIARFGGDASRVYLVGHSAGGHLASLVALDEDYQRKAGIPAGAIRGVASISGIYDVGTLAGFGNADDDPSPMDHVHANAPPFLVTYCQWDYFGLPLEAREFVKRLEKEFVPVRMVYVAGENHISEIVSAMDDGAVTRALLDFLR